MQVNSIRSYSAPRVAFGNEGEAAEKKQINKKAVIAAGATAAAAVAAVGTTAYALHRGKVVEGKDAKFFTKLKEGFKSFAGEGRKNYLEKLKANLQDMINNGKKGKDGTVTQLSKEAAEKAQNKINKLDEQINKATEKLAKKGAKAAPEGEKAVAEGVETIVEDTQAAQ